MREERLKILSMLQEGKITPEEAERLLAALSGGARDDGGHGGPGHGGPGGGPRRHHRGFWDFDFDFTAPFEQEFRRFGPIFDENLRRKFHEKARSFRNTMRWADEDARREAKEAIREAAEAVKSAMESSHLKETVESIGKTVISAMEDVMRRFGGEKPGPRPEKPEDPKPTDDDKTQTV